MGNTICPGNLVVGIIKVNFTIMVFNDFYRLLKEVSTKEVMPEIRGSENISMDPKKMEMIHFSHIQQKSVIVTLNYIKLTSGVQ
jgi:hypothetical protein